MHRRSGLVSLAAAGSLLLCAANQTSGCNSTGQIGPSNGEVYGAAAGIAAGVAVGVVVLVEVNKSHHTIKGCVTAGPGGLEVQNEKDNKVYALTGVTANVKAGEHHPGAWLEREGREGQRRQPGLPGGKSEPRLRTVQSGSRFNAAWRELGRRGVVRLT